MAAKKEKKTAKKNGKVVAAPQTMVERDDFTGDDEADASGLFAAKGPSRGRDRKAAKDDAKAANQKPLGERAEIKALLEKGKDQGFVTMDEVNDALPDDAVSSEQIDEVFEIFAKAEIETVDKK